MSSSDPFDDPPETSYGIEKRTALRLALAVVTVVVVVAIWFRAPLAGVWGLLWPPAEFSGRWFTLVMVVAFALLKMGDCVGIR